MPFKNTRVPIKFYEEFVVALKNNGQFRLSLPGNWFLFEMLITGKEIEIWIDYDKLALNRDWLETFPSVRFFLIVRV